MLQYLLNATAIWLISLVIFDVFLRRENYHGYNRFFLLFTFLLGAVLPLIQWQNDTAVYHSSLSQPIEHVITAKQNIVSVSVTDLSLSWEQWLMVIYSVGVLIALLILLVDIIKLLSFYNAGKRSKGSKWTIVETGKDHAPFSFLNILFTGSRQQYSDEEWNIILTHEQRHESLLHFTDVLLMQVARIVFWFHPLVYVYNKRLLLLHEFQADSASAKQPQAYGKFLIEQAVLQSAPAFTHSFNRSPIKKRIVMLTRRSSFAARTKMLVFIPLALVCIVCFSKNSFSQKFIRKGNIVTYNGNTFEFYVNPEIDTQILTDPVTGEQITKYIKHDPVPIKMNGKPIPKEIDKPPYFTSNYKNLREYLLKNLKNELSKFDDGLYTFDITNVLVDEHGKIVYFDYADIHRRKTNAEPASLKEINKALQADIFKKVCNLMDNAPSYIPAKSGGKAVVAGIPDYQVFWNQFKVEGHKLYDGGRNGAYEPL